MKFDYIENYIENAFAQHQYPKSFIQHAEMKAFKIHKRKRFPNNNNFSFVNV